MKISYRATSVAVLLILLAMILTAHWWMRSPRPATVPENGGIAFEIHEQWSGIGWIEGFSSAVWFVTFVMLIVQGLRNRTVARTVALASLATLGITIYQERWCLQHCYSICGIATVVVWVSAVSLMCLQHAFQPPSRTSY